MKLYPLIALCLGLDLTTWALTWTPVQTGVTGQLRGGAHGANTYVVTMRGAPGGIITSQDTVYWTFHRLDGDMLDVAYGSGRFVAIGTFGALFTSDDGTTWTPQPRFTSQDLQAIIYDGSQFVMGGGGGEILTSPDGIIWAHQNSTVGKGFYAMAYGEGRYVAVGTDQTVVWSDDAVHWSATVVTPTFMGFHGVGHGNGIWVAVGNPNSQLWSSPDGARWTQRSSGISADMDCVAYACGKFWVSSYAGQVLSSPDGINWIPDDTRVSTRLLGIKHLNGRLLAFGDYGVMIQAIPGEEPLSIRCPADMMVNADPDQCSAVVHYPGPAATANCSAVPTACVPPSGSTFAIGNTTVNCTATDGSGNTVACSFHVTVADAPISPVLVFSDDFSTSNSAWRLKLMQTLDNQTAADASYAKIEGGQLRLKGNVGCGWDYLQAVATLDLKLPEEFILEYRANKLQWCGSFYTFIMGTNDYGFSDGYRPPPLYLIAVAGNWFGALNAAISSPVETNAALPVVSAFNYGQWYHYRIVKRHNSVRIFVNDWLQWSYDGPFFDSGFLHFVACTAGATVDIDDVKLFALQPSLAWEPVQTGVAGALRGGTYGNGTYMVTMPGPPGGVITSQDAIHWTYQGLGGYIMDVAFGNGTFVASGGDGMVYVSSDATTWASQFLGTWHDLQAILHDGRQFVIAAGGGQIYTSPDGLDWTRQSSALGMDLYGIAFGGGRYVAVGAGPAIVWSDDAVHWQRTVITSLPIGLSGVGYGNGMWVAVGNPDSQLWSSLDGEHWTKRNPGITAGMDGVTYASGRFWVSSYSGHIISSTDGVNWVPEETGVTTRLEGIKYLNGRLLAFGDNGVMIQAIPLDTEPPKITCQADLVVNTDPGQCSAVVDYPVPSATDKCAEVPVSCRPPSGSNFAIGTTTVTCTASDASGNTATCSFGVTVANASPAITTVTGPTGPLSIGSSAGVTVHFADPDAGQGHTVTFSWGDGTSSTVAADPGVYTVTATHTYAGTGVYAAGVTVADPCGASTSATFEFVVIYDPNGGFVTGGGWINSPAGALGSDSSLTGKATFGFVSKYRPGAKVPSGSTEFQFKAGDFSFRSTTYEWLVVAGAKAQFKGTGTVNGVGRYDFLLSAVDGERPGGGGVDKFRIKITDPQTGAVYDNMLGASDDLGQADPQAIAGGSIVVHKP